MKTWVLCAGLLAGGLAAGCSKSTAADPGQDGPAAQRKPAPNPVAAMKDKTVKTDAEWKKELTPEQYRVLRQKGTERAFTGRYWDLKEPGVYRCAGCGQELFVSDTKFDSGCGWPSYYAPMNTNVITTQDDFSNFMHRTEVMCSRCGGHLGHLFDDGPKPTGLRYCINSESLQFEAKPGATNEPSKK